jgi:RsiW-degrading membrane proteinase PrsW (M82 family)
MSPLSDASSALFISLAVAVVYLLLIRLLDLNEREPFWSTGLLFLFGFAGAGLVNVVVRSTLLELTVLPGAFAEELGKFLAIWAGLAMLAAAARLRGWSEFNGLMDGVIYGAAAGLGYAACETFVRELRVQDLAITRLNVSTLDVLWTSALTGLAHGLFGAIIGAGFGAAAHVYGAARRLALPLAGLVAAVLVHAGYRVLAYGDALGGSSAVVRLWIALLIPLVLIIAVIAYALLRERRTIAEELASETESGMVTADDLALLGSHGRRQSRYFSTLARGELSRCAALMALHNRQVQLALAKRRVTGETDSERLAAAQAEIERLRAALSETRSRLEAMSARRRGGAFGS